jgi:hypothetical protein
MTTLLSDAASNLAGWTVCPPTQAKAMQIAYVRLHGRSAVLQLTPKGLLGQVSTPWAPSVYNGTGNEPRQTITFSVPDEIRQQMELIEEAVRDCLKQHMPSIDAIWSSSTKPPSKHASILRAKIVVSGDKACPCFNAAGEPVALPTDWVDLAVLPIIAVKSVYLQKGMAGLVLEVVSLMVGERQEAQQRSIDWL